MVFLKMEKMNFDITLQFIMKRSEMVNLVKCCEMSMELIPSFHHYHSFHNETDIHRLIHTIFIKVRKNLVFTFMQQSRSIQTDLNSSQSIWTNRISDKSYFFPSFRSLSKRCWKDRELSWIFSSFRDASKRRWTNCDFSRHAGWLSTWIGNKKDTFV